MHTPTVTPTMILNFNLIQAPICSRNSTLRMQTISLTSAFSCCSLCCYVSAATLCCVGGYIVNIRVYVDFHCNLRHYNGDGSDSDVVCVNFIIYLRTRTQHVFQCNLDHNPPYTHTHTQHTTYPAYPQY